MNGTTGVKAPKDSSNQWMKKYSDSDTLKDV